MMRYFLWALVVALLAESALAFDVFDRHTSYWVQQAARGKEPVKELSSRQAAELKSLSARVTSPFVVVQTGEGNWAKALVSWGFRKGKPAPRPVLLIERYVTYDRDRRDVAVARGKNVMLFPGFQFDFDLGQVVPAGTGGEIEFNAQRRLVSLEGAALYGVSGSVLPPSTPDNYDPNGHAEVKPRDFSGTWRVNADGRWRGVWRITVDDEGHVSGQYTSDETASTFPLKGKVVSTDVPHRLVFEVEFAAATQRYELFLWTTDKSALAGTTTLIDRKFGVFALREEKPRPANGEKMQPAGPALPEKLKRKVSLRINDPWSQAAEKVAHMIAAPLVIHHPDLVQRGISNNQRVKIDVRERPAEDALRAILAAADPGGELVYVQGKANGGEAIVVTTRRAARERGYRLPPELRRPMAKLLERPITLRLEGQPVMAAFSRWSRAAGVPLLVRREDLTPAEGAEDLRVSFSVENRPAIEALRKLLEQPFADGRPICLPANVDGHAYLVLTTLAAAKKRGERIPVEFLSDD